jgi:hypothetical protein
MKHDQRVSRHTEYQQIDVSSACNTCLQYLQRVDRDVERAIPCTACQHDDILRRDISLDQQHS